MYDREPPLGELYKVSSKRWALNDKDLTSGSRLQVKIDRHWIDIVVECDEKGYYAIPFSVRLLKGLEARFPGQWGE